MCNLVSSTTAARVALLAVLSLKGLTGLSKTWHVCIPARAQKSKNLVRQLRLV